MIHLAGIAALVVALIVIKSLGKKSFSVRVSAGLLIGVVLGAALKALAGQDASSLAGAMPWYALVGSGYVALLRMISIPLIMVSILSAIMDLETTKGLAKRSAVIILILVATAAVAAAVGVIATRAFDLRSDAIMQGEAEQQRGEYMEGRAKADLSVPAQLLKIVPSNPFAAMAGQGDNATLSVVLFSTLLAVAVLILRQEEPELAGKFASGVRVMYGAITELTWMILDLTPYGVCAIMARTVAQTDYAALEALARFMAASYVALAVVFVLHLVVLALFGFGPATYLRKAWPVLSFAFVSRTSAGALPMTISTLHDAFGLERGLSGFAASLGTSIGQNGCAGVYPAMLAVMIAPTLGIDPMAPAFLAQLLLTVAIGSFGVAGVGGGATFAAIIVLSALGFPVGLAGVLVSIEPVIDMGRTALNVSGSMLAGLLAGRAFGEVDGAVYADPSARMAQADQGA